MNARAIAVLALLAACITYVGPSAAFDQASFSRSVTATIVDDAGGYLALTIPSACSVLKATGGPCTFTVTNKGTVQQYYNLTLDSGGVEDMTYSIGGSSAVETGRVMAPNPVAVGDPVTATVTFPICPTCTSGTASFVVEGEKAGVLNAMVSRFAFPYTYT